MHRHVPEFMTSISSLRIYLNVSSMLMLYKGWKSAVRICEACRSSCQLILRPKLSSSRKRKAQIYLAFSFFSSFILSLLKRVINELDTRILPKFQFLIRALFLFRNICQKVHIWTWTHSKVATNLCSVSQAQQWNTRARIIADDSALSRWCIIGRYS